MRSSPRRAAAAAALVLLLALPPSLVQGASWQSDDGDWPQFRRTADRGGRTAGEGAFTASVQDLRVKWDVRNDPGFWVPPVAADLDGDGVAEVVAAIGNASIGTNPPAINLVSGFQVRDGATGALRWQHGPTTGNLVFYSPTLGDVDGDGRGDIVVLDGNPLTGTFATNKVLAFRHDGEPLWEWSDASWGSKVPLPLNGLAIGDVDGESARDEVVALLLLAKVEVGFEGTKAVVALSQPEQRLVALNGEGGGSVSWQRTYPNASINTPVLADLDGDGTLDVAWGSGAEPGPLVDSDELAITLSEEFADHTVRAVRGGGAPGPLWELAVPGHWPGEVLAPLAADLDLDGLPEFATHLWNHTLPDDQDASEVLAVDRHGQALLRAGLAGAVIAPLAAGDLDGDGGPELVAQLGDGPAGARRTVVALRADDGSVLWRSAPLGRDMSSAPAVGDLTGDGRPEVAVVLEPRSGAGSTLVLLRGSDGGELWRKDLDPTFHLGGPLLVDLDGDDDGRLEVLFHVGVWGKPGRMMALEPELPDLRVHGLALGRAVHGVGDAETVTATVTNAGSRPAAGVEVLVTDGADHVATFVLDLEPGAARTVSAEWVPRHGGPRTLAVAADPGKHVAEWSETDNRAAAEVFVEAPDLRFAAGDPAFSDPRPAPGDTIEVVATLTNAGHRDAPEAVVRFLDDGAPFASLTVANLAAGEAREVRAPLRVEGERVHTVRVEADPEGLVAEEGEDDNAASQALRVRFLAPDLVLGPADLALSDPNPQEDDLLRVQVAVRNRGSEGRDARDVLVRLLDRGAPAAEAVVPLVPAGGQAVATLAMVARDVGPHALEVVLDPLGAVNELDETNNRAAARIVVGKVQVHVALEQPRAGTDEQARGEVRLFFRDATRPLADHEFTLPVEYVVRVPQEPTAAREAATLAAAALAQARATVEQGLRICLAGHCVAGTLDQALALGQLVGAGAGLGVAGPELRVRVATLELRSNRAGAAAFEVPFSAFHAFGTARGGAGAEACASGHEPLVARANAEAAALDAALEPHRQTINALLAALGSAAGGLTGQEVGLGSVGPLPAADPPRCAQEPVPLALPGLPGLANLPGCYRATASVDWHGFGFQGRADYAHLVQRTPGLRDTTTVGLPGPLADALPEGVPTGVSLGPGQVSPQPLPEALLVDPCRAPSVPGLPGG